VKILNAIADFWKGVIVGAIIVLIIMSLILALVISHDRNKEKIEYAERQIEIEALREDYRSRDSVEFLELPSVRRAADRAASDFDRQRDEIIQRFRNELDNRSVDGSGTRSN
jgi:cell division septum initiation protein DivIVA